MQQLVPSHVLCFWFLQRPSTWQWFPDIEMILRSLCVEEGENIPNTIHTKNSDRQIE